MSTETDYLSELIDKVRAIIECGAGKSVELARFVMPERAIASASVQISQWLHGDRTPNGESTLRIQSWAAVKTLEIQAAGLAMIEGYNRAFMATDSGKRAKRAADAAARKAKG